MNNDNPCEARIKDLIHKGCKKKAQVMDAIKGSKIETDARFKMNTAPSHISELDAHISACLTEMAIRASKLANQFSRIISIPGISETSATIIISEIGVNMEVW